MRLIYTDIQYIGPNQLIQNIVDLLQVSEKVLFVSPHYNHKSDNHIQHYYQKLTSLTRKHKQSLNIDKFITIKKKNDNKIMIKRFNNQIYCFGLNIKKPISRQI